MFEVDTTNWDSFEVNSMSCIENMQFKSKWQCSSMNMTDDRCPILYHFVSIFSLRFHYIWQFTVLWDMRQAVGCGSILSIRSIVRVYARNIFFYVVSIFYRDFIVSLHFYVKRKRKSNEDKTFKNPFRYLISHHHTTNSKWLKAKWELMLIVLFSPSFL